MLESLEDLRRFVVKDVTFFFSADEMKALYKRNISQAREDFSMKRKASGCWKKKCRERHMSRFSNNNYSGHFFARLCTYTFNAENARGI